MSQDELNKYWDGRYESGSILAGFSETADECSMSFPKPDGAELTVFRKSPKVAEWIEVPALKGNL